jgi:hypothetical protein
MTTTNARPALDALLDDDDDFYAAVRDLLIDINIDHIDDIAATHNCDPMMIRTAYTLLMLMPTDDIDRLRDAFELCTLHHIDSEICADDDNPDCRHLR